MPLILEPDQRIRIVLESDKSKPSNEQPYFLFRALSCRETKKVVRIADSVYEDDVTGEQAVEKLIKAISVSLIGWGNMIDPATKKEIPFGTEEWLLDSLITMPEAQELMQKIQSQGTEDEELKNSESPSE